MVKINLNSIIYKECFTKEDLYKIIAQEEIFAYYLGDTVRIGLYNSPFRQDDNPSFSLYYRRDGSGVLMFYDHATRDCGDCIVFVAKLFGITHIDALYKVAFDFKLSTLYINEGDTIKRVSQVKKIIQNPVKLGIKRREWRKRDADYWKIFGIRKATLIKYKVVPVEYIFFNGNPVKMDKITYAYQENKDGKISFKIYQPYRKDFKWINNANYSIHQGYTQLPLTGELLIITKSLKDVMSLHDVIDIPSIGLQSESVRVKNSVMDEYKRRFNKVLCLFDNDKAGKNFSSMFSKDYNVSYFFMPEIKGVTDFSDLVKVVGIEKSKQIFNKCIKNEIK